MSAESRYFHGRMAKRLLASSPRAVPVRPTRGRRLCFLRGETLENRLVLAHPVGTEFRVPTTTTNNQVTWFQTPNAIAADDDGDFVVTWSGNNQLGDVGWGVYGRRFDKSGNPLGNEFHVNTTVSGDQRFSSVAVDADGDFVIVWSSQLQDGSGLGIYGQRYDSAGTAQGGEFRVNTQTFGDQKFPSVAMSATGEFVVVWTSNGQDADGSAGIYAQAFSSNGAVQGGEFQVHTDFASTQDFARIARNKSGDFVVTWSSFLQSGEGFEIKGQRYSSSGGAAGGEFHVNSTMAGDQRDSAVAIADDGRFVVTWSSEGQDLDGSVGIYAQRFNGDGSTAGNEFRVANTEANSQDFARVAMQPRGDFTVTWNADGQDGDGFAIYGREFLADGSASADEFRVNSTTTNDQMHSAIAVDRHGDYVIAWTSNFQDPDFSSGIFAQRYEVDNTAPTSSGIADVQVEVNSPNTVIDLFAAFEDAEDPDADLVYTVVGNTNLVLFDAVNVVPGNPTSLVLDYALDVLGESDLTVRATDPLGLFVETTFRVTVIPLNNPPTTSGIADVTADEDANPTVIDLFAVFDDVEDTDSQLTFVVMSVTNPGLFSFAGVAAGTPVTLRLEYAANANGNSDITVRATDRGGKSVDTTFSVTLNPVNDGPPTANAITADGAEDTKLVIQLTGSVGVDLNESLTASISVPPIHGKLYQTPDGSTLGAQITAAGTQVTHGDLKVIFVPEPELFGTAYDSFRFRVNDGELDSADANVVINIAAVNDPPIALPDDYVLGDNEGDSNSTESVAINDRDIDSTAVQAILDVDSAKGTLQFQGDGSFTYTPLTLFKGIDSFQYHCEDEDQNSQVVTVTVLTHNAALVRNLYRDLLARDPELAGWEFWSDALEQSTVSMTSFVKTTLESGERIDRLVQQMYLDLLNRSAEASALAFWRKVWRNDGGGNRVIQGILSSAEFFVHSGGTNSAFVTAIYPLLLQRSVDSSSLAFWVSQLNSGQLNRTQVASALLNSAERNTLILNQWFIEFLNRPADSAAKDFFVNQLVQGAKHHDIQSLLLNSAEYRSNPIPPSVGNADRF